MAYVQPNSTIILCYGVPFAKDYEHTVRFNTSTDQYNGLISYKKYEFSAQSYQRYDKGTLRIQVVADNILDCNYLMFQNTAFGNKWFYAFIDSVEYINNVTTEVRYTIDVMQTYMFNYNLQDCFVIREHSATDNVGDNLVPENIGLGNEICHYESSQCYDLTTLRTVIVYMPNYSEDLMQLNYIIFNGQTPEVATSVPTEQYRPSIRNKFGGGVCCLVVPNIAEPDHAIITSQAIAKILSVGGSIITTFQIPAEVYADNFNASYSFQEHDFVHSGGTGVNERGAFVYAKNPNTSYSPRNMKLLQYPFRKLVVSNGNGGIAEYNWELFTDRHAVTIEGLSKNIPQANFKYFSAMLPDPMARCYPLNYRGKFLYNSDFDSGVTLTEFPRQCYSEDSYAAWKAQNSSAMAISGITGAVSNVTRLTFATTQYGKAMSGATGIEDIANITAQETKAKNTPDTVVMQTNSPIINLMYNRLGFTCYDIGITGEMAEVIDDFFDTYGYATNKVKTPNFVGSQRRPYWNYVQLGTVNMNTERLPAEAEAEIHAIYNKGITFWERLADVGNYDSLRYANRV